MDAIEQKEIRGLSLKSMYWLLGTTAMIIFTVLFTYFSILNKLATMEVQKVENEKYNDLRIRTLDLKVSTIEVQIQKLEDKLDRK